LDKMSENNWLPRLANYFAASAVARLSAHDEQVQETFQRMRVRIGADLLAAGVPGDADLEDVLDWIDVTDEGLTQATFESLTGLAVEHGEARDVATVQAHAPAGLIGGLFPKIEALPGSLHVERKTCGRSNCRCAAGALHGPYLYRRWREGGRLRRQYVRPCDAERVQAALTEWRRLHPPTWQTRQELAYLRRLVA
jgi:hypothetical protein